jgi:hypothetical protein
MFMHYELVRSPVARLVGSKSSCSYVRACATSALKGHLRRNNNPHSNRIRIINRLQYVVTKQHELEMAPLTSPDDVIAASIERFSTIYESIGEAVGNNYFRTLDGITAQLG